MIALTIEQKARFDDWFDDCNTTHRHFAHTVRDIVLPHKLNEATSSNEIDTYLGELERSLKAMRATRP